jgi:adenine-specific DNA-methyltransferase
MQYEFGKPGPVLSYVEQCRMKHSHDSTQVAQKALGQYLTPASVACFMASLFEIQGENVRLLDPGAGMGALTAAFIDRILALSHLPKSVTAVAWEVDSTILPLLHKTLRRCHEECRQRGVDFTGIVIPEDFTKTGSEMLLERAVGKPTHTFNCAILNPPYRKIGSSSPERLSLRRVDIETSNLYTGFVALATRLLEQHGQLVAITPRSFCNGPYFKAFRNHFLQEMRFQHVHTFARRDAAFADDGVLQENIIFHASKDTTSSTRVEITHSAAPRGTIEAGHRVEHSTIVAVEDPERIIHIPNGNADQQARMRVSQYQHTLTDIGVSVSTGRVVEFRAKQYLRAQPTEGAAPLIYPGHFNEGYVAWPNATSRKPNAIQINDTTRPMLVPTGFYALVKRFTSKEEPRRIVAVVFDPRRVNAEEIAYENHVNFFHVCGHGMPEFLAKGIAAYLNTSLVDQYFRQFSGHTQVNAADLRSLTYPPRETLERLGGQVSALHLNQKELDTLVEKELSHWQEKNLRLIGTTVFTCGRVRT